MIFLRAISVTAVSAAAAVSLTACITIQTPQPASTPSATATPAAEIDYDANGCANLSSGMSDFGNAVKNHVSPTAYADATEKLAFALNDGVGAAGSVPEIKQALIDAATATAKVTDILRSPAEQLSTAQQLEWTRALDAALAVCKQPLVDWVK